jgi:dolichol kinase
MLETLVAVGPLFFLLIFSELLWRTRLLRGEPARKCLHIIIGSYVASWPYFMTFEHIQWLGIAMLVGVVLSHKFHIFHAITDVKRHSWGDILYAVGMLLAATLAQAPWVFALAILHMSIADGLAGLVGSHYGKSNQYTVFGHRKSWIGSGAFIIASMTLMLLFLVVRPDDITPLACLGVPFLAAALENIGIKGSDNVLIPTVLVLLFR